MLGETTLKLLYLIIFCMKISLFRNEENVNDHPWDSYSTFKTTEKIHVK